MRAFNLSVRFLSARFGLSAARSRAVFAIALFVALPPPARGQHHPQVAVGAPFHQANNGFFEQVGVNFNAHGENWFFQQNAFGGAAPQFGGAQPGAGLNTGVGFQFPGGAANFNITAGQGATSGMTSVSPSVTVMNGQAGVFSMATETPFVIGLVPVVGEPPPPSWTGSPLGERLSRLRQAGSASAGVRPGSAAEKAQAAHKAAKRAEVNADSSPTARVAVGGGAASGVAAAGVAAAGVAVSEPAPTAGPSSVIASVAELKAIRAAAEFAAQREAETLAIRAREAEMAGKPGLARIYYQQAARRATGQNKDQWTARAAALSQGARSKTAHTQSARASRSRGEPSADADSAAP